MTPKSAHVLLQRAATSPGSRARRRGARRPAHLPLRRARRPARSRRSRCSRRGPRCSGTSTSRPTRPWDDIGAGTGASSRDQFVADDEVRRRVEEMTKGLKDDAPRCARSTTTSSRRRATSRSSSASTASSRTAARRCFARGFGDCKDKATLIVTMLREPASPRRSCSCGRACAATSRRPPRASRRSITRSPTCLRSTSTSTAPPSTPARPSFRRWTAARSRSRSTKGIPSSCTCPIRPPKRASRKRHVDVALAADGSAQFAVDMLVSGVYAPDWRQRYLAEGTRRERAERDRSRRFRADRARRQRRRG